MTEAEQRRLFQDLTIIVENLNEMLMALNEIKEALDAKAHIRVKLMDGRLYVPLEEVKK